MSASDSNLPATMTAASPAVADYQETRHQTERPPPQREGIVSDPDQYFPDLPRSATATPPRHGTLVVSDPDAYG